MADENDGSEAAAVASLMNIMPEDSLNMGNEEPATADPASQQAPQEPTAKAPEKPQEPAKQPTADEDAEIDYEGERYKVPSKLKDAFMRDKDYRQKTMELANQRKEFDAQKGQMPDPKVLEDYKTKLSTYETLLGEQVLKDQQINWKELLDKDPVEYLRQKEMAESRAKEWNETQAKRKTESENQFRQALTQESQQLIAKRPEWKDDTAWNSDREKITAFLQKEAYRQEEINGVVDHRALIVADKARRYDELMAAKTEVVKKIEKLPPKIERPGVPSDSDGQASKDAMSKLRKTGKVDDAAAAIRSLMN